MKLEILPGGKVKHFLPLCLAKQYPVYIPSCRVNLETLKCNFWFRQVESAPKVASPVLQYNSPKNVPAVSQNHKPIAPEQQQSEVDGAEVTQKKTFVFEMKTKGHVVSTCI